MRNGASAKSDASYGDMVDTYGAVFPEETVPWTETCAMRERERFIADHASGQWNVSELCERYGVSRTTGYKWLERYEVAGANGLKDRSRAPRSCPHQTPAAVVKLVLEEADRFGWGARKVLRRLEQRHRGLELPCARLLTVTTIVGQTHASARHWTAALFEVRRMIWTRLMDLGRQA